MTARSSRPLTRGINEFLHGLNSSLSLCFSAYVFICCLAFHGRNSPDMKAECLYKHLANTIKTVEFCLIGSEIIFFHIPAVSTLFTCRFTCRFSPILRVVLREVRGSERAIFLAGSCSAKEGVHPWGRCTRSVQSASKSVYVLETLISRHNWRRCRFKSRGTISCQN